MDVPVGQAAGVSARRARLWGRVGGLIVGLVTAGSLGSLVVPWLFQGAPLRELPFFMRPAMIALDYYALGMVGLGLVFLEGAIVALRASHFPRTDGVGAALLGTALCALGGLVLFARLCAIAHG
jgi:hypothetical protein